jgi:hypothetical protein
MRVESLTLEAYENTIQAAFSPKYEKQIPLRRARIKIEILKRLIRLARELNIIEEKQYLNLESQLQTISKMLAGWLKFVQS